MKRKIKRQQLTAAYHLSYTRFALNYYSYCEGITGEEGYLEIAKSLHKEILQLVDDLLTDTAVEERIQTLRSQIISSMEALTYYADCFQIYEYVLNRMEGRFKAQSKDLVPEKEAADSMMEYIMDSDNPSIMNRRIQMILGELPVFLTKSKFFSMVRESMSVFNGADKKTFEQFLYIIKSCSMLSFEKREGEEYRELNEILDHFFHVSYKSMDEENYDQLIRKVEAGSKILTQNSNVYFQLQQLINDLYVIFLSRKQAVEHVSEISQTKRLIQAIQGQLAQNDISMSEDQLTDLLIALEGKQEAYMEDYYRYDLSENAEDEDVRKITILLSDSNFADLGIDTSDAGESKLTVDDTCLDDQIKQLTAEWTRLFERVEKPIIRAIMAKVLSNVPVFFNSIDEVQRYIEESLECCTDQKEKKTCIQLIEELMVTDNAFL